ncbi:MAG: alanine--tRNA ligase-related protein [bacterium]|nr:alanine--tRNA ligase-related protein [bacterium]
MTSEDIRKKFSQFFADRGHAIVPSSSLIPTDPSVLLTTAGMQQFKPYFVGKADPLKDFGSKNTTSVQKSFRTSDIDEVGDESHLTFFEMLGNFSFGGPDASGKIGASYFKKEAIQYGYDFITKEMGLTIDFVSVFEGNSEVPRDDESESIWRSIDPKLTVKTADISDNFWGPTGVEGPCGPTTEIYVKNSEGKSIEVWNIVFNEFYYPGSRDELLSGKSPKKLEKSRIPGVDTGMGLERLAMVSQKTPTIFETDLFEPIMKLLPVTITERVRRIMADHARGIAFLISDGVRPSNKEAGYVLRRLMRRLIVHEYLANDPLLDLEKVLRAAVLNYEQFYPELKEDIVARVFDEEESKFSNTLQSGLKELNKMANIDAKSAFKLYESCGLPYEVIKELGGKKAEALTREGFDEEFKKHQEISRAGQEKKFGGHGLILNTGELKAGNEEELDKVLRLHTATHLLQRALREVLGNEIHQMGSDITAERTRFDFAFPRKMTDEEKKKVEDLINQKIKEDLPMQFVELPKAEAEKSGALFFFKEKYPDKVKVYFVGKDLASAWSKEFCGGPHVTHTGVIGKFRIAKEEAVGAGTRRIRGILDV